MALFSFLRRRVFWTWVLFTLAPCGVVAGVLAGVQAVGWWTRTGLHGSERFQVAFADIECTPPATLSPHDFLGEVQYLSGAPERINLLARELPLVLTNAFSRHPWVAAVERVEVLPGRKVRVHLVHRTPTLAVMHGGRRRVIDGQGVLLPATAASKDLPVYCSPVSAPHGGPGTEWGDPDLKSAAQTVAFLQGLPELKRLDLVQSTVTGLILTTQGGSSILWGQPADGNPGRMAAAQKKREWLVRYCQTHGDLDKPEGPQPHDLRWMDGRAAPY